MGRHRYVSAERYVSAGPTEKTFVDQKLAENPPKDSVPAEGLSSGETKSIAREGSQAYESGDYTDALRLFRLAADQGEAGAQRQLGDMYEFGWGIEKNIPMARHWYELAAGQGDPLAQNALRLMGSE